ncbi:MAG: cytochrome-c peroxidase [Bacteroidota bacterium]
MPKILSYGTLRCLAPLTTVIVLLYFFFGCTEEVEIFNTVTAIDSILPPLPVDIPVPGENPITPEKLDLGKQLFWDPILSGNKDVACATCHHPTKGYADGLDLSLGVGGVGIAERRTGGTLAKRNAHSVLNTAFNGIGPNLEVNPAMAPMFWDNRAMGLESQALLPLLSEEEMRGSDIPENALYDTLIKRLQRIPEYQLAFTKVFGDSIITTDRIAIALAAFERSLVANNSPFDQYMRGDTSAMTQQQINGMNAFVNIGCAECHRGPMFSDFELHTLGVPDNPKLAESDANGGTYAFRTPSLRNLSLTAPYMHSGVQTSLEEVMAFYEEVSEGDDDVINPNLSLGDIDPLARQLELDDAGIEEIIAFMQALNDPDFDLSIPNNVPSGLSVGGNIHN